MFSRALHHAPHPPVRLRRLGVRPTPSITDTGHRWMTRAQLSAMVLNLMLMWPLLDALPTMHILLWMCVRQGLSLLRIAHACDCLRHPDHHRSLICAGLTLLDAGTWLTLAWWLTPASGLLVLVQVGCVAAAIVGMVFCASQQLAWRRAAHQAA